MFRDSRGCGQPTHPSTSLTQTRGPTGVVRVRGREGGWYIVQKEKRHNKPTSQRQE